MNDTTSLDRLHDLVEPAPVSWWPLAPGWYVLIAAGVTVVGIVGWQVWLRWQANAYRRQAFQSVQNASSAAEIAEIIRRTALSFSARSQIASLTGESWVDWIEKTLPKSMSASMPNSAKRLLAGSIYAAPVDSSQLADLRRFAQTWVLYHQPVVTRNAGKPC
ncbi:DUF4381 domain-containing protein [Roseiconus lacunae]|uniref:DUF4381 domain-containing protein n=1 Tax=Roseiconus lacunae TaxID=2605694 RepID=UPI00135BAA5A|nr:DUF4381 domain-containing protein [Roseiconus lacunae]WRQ52493.1 DUF4381 domain-containing protein [Stieleria sp. HD01]